MQNNIKSFAFLVLAYNHQKYIIEHLESIKYLIKNYAKNEQIKIDLIISDDCSQDKTCLLINEWLEHNSTIFRNITKVYNHKNLGTCACVNKMLEFVVADSCKLTAGDDIYSYENIFEILNEENNVAFTTGRPLYLFDNELKVNRISNLLITATQVIYDRDKLINRFKHLSYINAPNLHYAKKCLLNSNVREFIKKFDVIEDWPLCVGISQEYPGYKFKLINKVIVYYRRTNGSIYIIANKRFINDKTMMFNYLIKNEIFILKRIRIISRILCLKISNKIFRKILNLDFYIFAISFICNFMKIYNEHDSLKIDLLNHKIHYATIKENANNFLLDRN